jgi:PAS domain S-box-containing protein
MESPQRQRSESERDLHEELTVLRERVAELEEVRTEYEQAQGEIERLKKQLEEVGDTQPMPMGMEQFLKQYLDHIDIYVFVKDLQGGYTYINAKAEKLFGLKNSDLADKPYTDADFYAGRSARTMRANDRMVLELDQALQFEENVQLADADERSFLSIKFPLKDPAGENRALCGFSYDVTERKQFEETLIKSRERLALALQGANDGLWDWNLETGEAYYSPRWKSMLGYADHEIEDQINEWERLVEPSGRQRARKMLDDYLAGAIDKFECELRMRHKDGHFVDVLSRAFALRQSSDGKPLRVIGTHVDITARKRTEQALRESRRLLYTVVNSAPIVLFSLDNSGVYTLSVGQGLEALGLQPGEVVGRSVWDVYPHEPLILDQCRRALAGEAFSATMQLGNVMFETLYSPLRNLDGDIIGAVGVSTDITQRIRAEEALRQAKVAAEAASQAKSVFLANMSHELRTPLNGILGYAQILKVDDTITDPQRESLNIIERSGAHLLRLVNDILVLSKVEAGKMELNITEFNLPKFLDGIASMFRARALHKGIEFDYRPMSALPVGVRADETRLSQVLLNLLGNALKFTQRGGVTFEVGYHFSKMRFQVTDTGIGIEKTDLETIFAPFHQVGDHQLMTEGTGLGLSISRHLVEMMGGELQVESAPGEGSRFWFDIDLPVVEGWLHAVDAEGPRIVGYEGRRRSVLIVDDTLANRSQICDMLIPLGFQVLEAEDADQGLEMARALSPDLILLDLVMPLANGFETARQMRADPKIGSGAVIITLSASAFGQHRQLSQEAGCDGFMAKPFNLDVLLGEIEKHLEVEWIYETDDLAHLPIDAPPSLVLPPPEVLEDLRGFSLRGQIVELKSTLDEIQGQNPSYDQFVTEIYALAGDFKLREIRKRLDSYLSESQAEEEESLAND